MPADDSHWDADTRYDRDCDREPRRTHRAPVGLTLRQRFACTSASHEAVKADPQAWAALGEAQYMPAYDEADALMVLALKTCACGSTLAKEEHPKTESALQSLRNAGLL